MDDTVVVALYRHGLTEANKNRAYLGWSDSPLCAVESIKPVCAPIDLLFSSDLGRCMTTNERLFPKVKPILLKELREMNFGAWEGKTYHQLKEDNRYQNWLNEWQTAKPPEGESFPEFVDRVDRAWNQIQEHTLANSHRRVAIVTHGGVIRHLLDTFVRSEKSFWDWEVRYAEGIELVFSLEGFRRKDSCILLQVAHLTEKRSGSVNNME